MKVGLWALVVRFKENTTIVANNNLQVLTLLLCLVSTLCNHFFLVKATAAVAAPQLEKGKVAQGT